MEENQGRAATVRAVVAALHDGHADRALDAVRAGLRVSPADPVLHGLAAAAAHQSGDYDAAVRSAHLSLASRPDHAPVLVQLGRSLRELGRLHEAATALRQAANLDPNRADAAFLLCATLLQAGDSAAGPMLEPLLIRFPGEAGGWIDVGRVLSRLGKSEAALVCWSRALRAAPKATTALQVGALQRELGRTGDAVQSFQQATRLDADLVRAWFMLGLCLQDTGKFDEAAAAYRRALTLDPTLAEAAVNLGTALQEAGDLDAAKVAYGTALRIRSDTFGRIAQAMTMARHGELWLDLGKLRESLGG